MAKKRTLDDASLDERSAVPACVDSPPEAAPEETDNHTGCRFPIVGIGASAGGLSAFKKFFSQMPSDSGVALILVPHLDPTHESLMAELLTRQTSMPVCEARDAMRIEPNHVYIIPPNKYLVVNDGTLQLSAPEGRLTLPTAIDVFFRSLADSQRERAIGIILSGTSSYGTPGLKEIKLAGGMVMVQEPETAEFDQMPRSAIATGVVDFVLPPEQMPAELLKYVRHPYVRGSIAQIAEQTPREQLSSILAVLRTRTKYDFRSYRKNMLLRRVMRRMGLCHLDRLADYLELLRNNADEVEALYKDLLISVTEFFRDSEAFQVLQQRVIPELLASRAQVRVWVPACATGEEAYSLAMLFIEQFQQEKRPVNLQIFATDINEPSLETARQGIYSEGAIVGISPERLQRFFVKTDAHHWQVNKLLRDTITFAAQNLISDAPFSRLDLIACRNLQIYLEPEVQAKVIRMFHFALSPGGYLFLGPSESIGRDVDLFEPVSKKWRVFRRIETVRRGLIEIPIVQAEGSRRIRLAPTESAPVSTVGFKELMQRLILDSYAPASVLINHEHEIVSVLGPLVNYLEFPPGEITKNLLAMTRQGLRTKLRTAIHRAIQTGEVIIDHDARVKREGGYVPCSITVKPLDDIKDAVGLLLITFQDRESPPAQTPEGPLAPSPEGEESVLIQHLEQELKATQDDLQGTIEEYESSVEELKASNEEVMSMNEELQSANEELETSKEELQSLNEELTTVNNQLQEKVEELDRSNSDLTNLMTSSEVATVFLDTGLRVKRFTPTASKLLNLRPTDQGRLFSELAPKIEDDSLLRDCHAVLDRLVPIEMEVWTKSAQPPPAGGGTNEHGPDDRCYLRRIVPYRSAQNQIDGVVITLFDITQRIASEGQSRRLATVLWDSYDAVTLHDFAGRILAWSRGAERMYGYSEAEALRMNIRDIVPEDKRAEALAYIERLKQDEAVTKFETQRVTKDRRVLDVELTVTAYRDRHGRPISVATTERDATEQKRSVLALQQLNVSLEQRVADQTREVKLLATAISHLGEGILITDNVVEPPGRTILFVNEAMCRIAGYTASELVGQTPRIFQGAQTSRAALDHIKQELTAGRDCHVELVNYRKDRTPFDLELFIAPIRNTEGQVTHFVSIHRDITDRKQAERQLHDREERLRAILDTASDAIITIDHRGLMTNVNAATLSMFGYAAEELLGHNVRMLMPQPYHDEHDGCIARYLKTGEARIIGTGREVLGRRKDGVLFPVDLSVSRVDDMPLFTGIIRDATLRKELQKQILEIASEEQRRIGHELHDGTQQELTGLTLLAGTLRDLLKSVSPSDTRGTTSWILDATGIARLRQNAELLCQRLTEANQHVQQLAHGIMPVQIDGQGLRSALQQLAASTDAPPQVSCRFECPAEIAVASNLTATHLYRIAQEAVTNALRHGQARQITIRLQQSEQQIELEVRDDGVGFDTTSARPPWTGGENGNMGLRIMEYRADLIGGRLSIEHPDDGGIIIRCTVPGLGESAHE